MDAHYYTAFCHEKIKQGLPNAKLKDSERLVNTARLLNTNAEIRLNKSPALISEKRFLASIPVTSSNILLKSSFIELLNLILA